jgi:GTP-binding protein
MAFVDELTIYARAGRGGDGVVRWRQDKFEDRGGPAGGDGGRGADVYIEGVKDSALLASYTHDTRFLAPNGEPGAKKKMTGEDGEDMYIKLPVGSVITKLDGEKEIFELTEEGQKILILKGGKGGLGNEHFKSSTNTTPYESTPGKAGEAAHFHVELRLFADLGLVGYPNAGKSTLINAVTNSKSKIGAYAFTTLDPHLGTLQEFVIADIPGIIEGASEGKGLGVKFLKHIKRTKTLAHLISFENEDMMQAYRNIQSELKNYDEELAQKPEVIILTKTDLVQGKEVLKRVQEFKKLKKPVFTMSAFDDESVKKVADELVKILRTK